MAAEGYELAGITTGEGVGNHYRVAQLLAHAFDARSLVGRRPNQTPRPEGAQPVHVFKPRNFIRIDGGGKDVRIAVPIQIRGNNPVRIRESALFAMVVLLNSLGMYVSGKRGRAG